MTRQYILQGLDCANCASKIERDVQKLDGVAFASVNLTTATLEVKMDGDMTDKIEAMVHKHEPDVEFFEKTTSKHVHEHDHAKGESGRLWLLKLAAGGVFLAAGLILQTLPGTAAYLTIGAFLVSYVILGWDVVRKALVNIVRGQIFDENFLMSAATVGAFVIREYPEAAAVMLFYQVGEYFQEMAVRKSRKSIADLMDIRPDFARVMENGEERRVSPEAVSVGELIFVRPGEKIPLDGVVAEGSALIDTAALTGESVPREITVGDTVLSGCVNTNGVLAIKVSKPFGESTAAKILDLVENASGKKSRTESFITTFSRVYTPAVVGLAALIAVLPPLLMGGGWSEWIRRGLIFLVISCPCALVISIPLGFFGGIGNASRKGILVKGGNYLEALGSLDIVVFDKTGTLTEGVFEVTGVHPAGTYTKDSLLELAAAVEAFSGHPIALSIQRACDKKPEGGIVSDYREIPGQGVSARLDGRPVLAGNAALLMSHGIEPEETGGFGTKVYLSYGGVFAGTIVISDRIKPDSQKAVSMLKERGVGKIVMLTGDNAEAAGYVAESLKLDEVHSGLLPAQKLEKLENIDTQKKPKGKLAFVGDGVNDAPALARADIGIAMGVLGSDAAIEAADIALMTDEPSKLAEAVDVARFTRRVVKQNIFFALAVKGAFLLLGALGEANMAEAVFADVGVSLLAVLNSLRIIMRR